MITSLMCQCSNPAILEPKGERRCIQCRKWYTQEQTASYTAMNCPTAAPPHIYDEREEHELLFFTNDLHRADVATIEAAVAEPAQKVQHNG